MSIRSAMNAFSADESKRMLEFVADTAEGRLEDYRVGSTSGRGWPDGLPPHWHILGGRAFPEGSTAA
jgi:hypothetical protein